MHAARRQLAGVICVPGRSDLVKQWCYMFGSTILVCGVLHVTNDMRNEQDEPGYEMEHEKHKRGVSRVHVDCERAAGYFVLCRALKRRILVYGPA